MVLHGQVRERLVNQVIEDKEGQQNKHDLHHDEGVNVIVN